MLVVDSRTRSDCADAAAINNGNLLKILADAKDTQFGRKYGFDEISDADAYRKKVPLGDYKSFEPYITEMFSNGGKDLITSYRVVSFCTTSGTEGAQKHIPLTAEALSRYSDISERYKNKVMKSEKNSKRLFVNTFHTDIDGDIENSLLFSEIYNRYLYENGFTDISGYVGGKPLLFNKKRCNMFYARAWAAVLEENIVLIESAFLYDVLQFFAYLEKNGASLLDDIRSGIVRDKELPRDVKETLLAIDLSKERLCTLSNEFSKGFDGIAKRIWPRLRLICGISGKAFSFEDAALKKYIGDTPLYYLAYCSSECYIGTPVAENDFGYVLLPSNAFYEFIPYGGDNDDDEKTLLPAELTVGGLYEIAVTTFSGLYRYRMGDILRVREFYGESPVLEFEFRKNQALNIAGEKTAVSQLEAAVSRIKVSGTDISGFCFCASADVLPGRYIGFMATDDKNADETHISEETDKTLMELNSDYRELRELGHIDRPQITLMSKDEYEAFISSRVPQYRHNKPIHIITCGK